MTRRVTVQLVCDHCATALRQSRVGETIDELREQLAKVGWWSNKANDSDLCPSCLARGAS